MTVVRTLPVSGYVKSTSYRKTLRIMIGDKAVGFFTWCYDCQWVQHRDTVPIGKQEIIAPTTSEAVQQLLTQHGYLGSGTA